MKSNEIKNKAYELVIMQGMQQKEVAKILGVAENTVFRWAKTWKKCPMIKKPTMESITDIEDSELRNNISSKLLKMLSNVSHKI